MNPYLARAAAAALLITCAAPGTSANLVPQQIKTTSVSVLTTRAASPPGCRTNGKYYFIGVDVPKYGPNYAGGTPSTADLGLSFVGAGVSNQACDSYTAIAAGIGNVIGGDDRARFAAIAGGTFNAIEASVNAFIGAGQDNAIGGGVGSAIVSGYTNSEAAAYSFIGAGQENAISSGTGSAIISGYRNSGTAQYAFIGAGARNSIGSNGNGGVITGGGDNLVSGSEGSIIGGQQNAVSGQFGVAAGGYLNIASGMQSTIGGGYANSASGTDATIPGGASNFASGSNAFAAGTNSDAANTGAFVWSDASTGATTLASSASNQFLARAAGGFYLYSSANLKSGVELKPGSGSWSTLSDRSVKTDVEYVDDARILAKVAALPVSEWSYSAQGTGVRHLGPMAQDFHVAFGLGEDNRHISTVDEEGVALAAIKALHTENNAKDRQISQLAAQHVADEARFANLEKRLDALEARVSAAR